jgi:superfamily II DNA or RNA helicase
MPYFAPQLLYLQEEDLRPPARSSILGGIACRVGRRGKMPQLETSQGDGERADVRAQSFLRELPTPHKLETSTNDLLREFYVPALACSERYDRGVGFFTAGWLRMASAGLVAFAGNGGVARVVASPILYADEVEALRAAEVDRGSGVVERAMERSLDDLERSLESDTLAAIGWMVADGMLLFKVACPANELDGDFHDKFGVFSDAAGDTVAFSGSQNDSVKAFRNYESINVYYSWMGDREALRVTDEAKRFDRLWQNHDPNVRTYDVPDAVQRRLIEYRERAPRPYRRPPPSQDHRWRHQKEALAIFLEKRRGILEMATGTGKTRTAISIINELFARGSARTAIVSAFGTDLLDQWYGVLVKEGHPVYRSYGGHHEALQYLNDPEGSVLLSSRQKLVEVLPRLSAPMTRNGIIVCDEVHGMGAPSMVQNLAGQLKPFGYALGLSATPDREYDAAGNDFIEAEIGPVIFEFGLEKAIRRGILCEFDYLELDYAFSADDKAAARQAIKRYHARSRMADAPPIESLYQELARIRKLSREKWAPFAALVSTRPDVLQRSIIFVEEAPYGLEVQQLLMPTGVDFHTYYAGDDRANLPRFARGELDCLITCHRISEGIDIRSVGTIVLFASARAKLETVQRLGRCLRVDPEAPGKRALVIDFIRTDDIDPDEPEATADVERRDWFRALAAVQREE